VLDTISSGTFVDSTSGGFLDSSQGVLAVTCLGGLLAILSVRYVDCSRGALVAASHLNWCIRFAVHHSSASGLLIALRLGLFLIPVWSFLCFEIRYSVDSVSNGSR